MPLPEKWESALGAVPGPDTPRRLGYFAVSGSMLRTEQDALRAIYKHAKMLIHTGEYTGAESDTYEYLGESPIFDEVGPRYTLHVSAFKGGPVKVTAE